MDSFDQFMGKKSLNIINKAYVCKE